MLDEANFYQDFRTQVHDMKDLVGDMKRLVRKDFFRRPTTSLPSWRR